LFFQQRSGTGLKYKNNIKIFNKGILFLIEQREICLTLINYQANVIVLTELTRQVFAVDELLSISRSDKTMRKENDVITNPSASSAPQRAPWIYHNTAQFGH